VVTDRDPERVAAELSTAGWFVVVCGPRQSAVATTTFVFGALLFGDDVSTIECAEVCALAKRHSKDVRVLHCWDEYPGGLASLVSEHLPPATAVRREPAPAPPSKEVQVAPRPVIELACGSPAHRTARPSARGRRPSFKA
jgi:hypothetical protein